jgi:hypothetical protein
MNEALRDAPDIFFWRRSAWPDRPQCADRTRWGENNIDCERSYAAELVALEPDVIRCQHP